MEFQEIQGMNLNPRELYLMFRLQKKTKTIHMFFLWLVYDDIRMLLGVIPMFCFGILRIFGGNRKKEKN